MSPAGVVIVALWIVWLVTWVLVGLFSDRAVVRQGIGGRLAHNALLWAGAYVLVGQAAWLRPIARPLLREPAWTAWSAVAVACVGFAWMWWARWHIGRLWSGAVTLKAGHRIVRSGPYRLTRHPIYTGLMLAAVASAVVRDAWTGVVGLALITLGVLLKIKQEEALLLSTFGAEYERYRHDVPALIPGIV